MMRTTHRLLFLCLTLSSSGAWAQGVQNSDIFWLFGANSIGSETAGGGAATLSAGTAVTIGYGYGYQIVRKSAASLWVEYSSVSGGVTPAASIPGKVDLSWSTFTAGARFMIPVQSRISIYAVAGGGAGDFKVPEIMPGPSPSISSTSTWHGVFDFGGGVDVRLSRRFSIRAEVRDYVSGTGLSGAMGRNRASASGGLALHF